MADWNEYINSLYYPENTSADAPEKILYFFIRDELCSNPKEVEFTKESNETKWNEIFDKIDFKSSNIQAIEAFKEYYLIKLQEGRTGTLPVPFHVDIPCTFKIISKTKAMDNKGFSKKFLLVFFSNGDSINYDLIKKLWNVVADEEGLNYYEKLIVDRLKELGYKTDAYNLKSEQDLNNRYRSFELYKFKCKHQPLKFQEDLEYILSLHLSRVEKIGWVNNIIYFHFSTYMMRIFYVIKLEEENFLDENVDYCSKCTGLNKCPYKSKIIVKSSITGNNREANTIKVQYKELVNNVLIKGYYRFIALNQLFKVYKDLVNKYPENIKDVSDLYKEKTQEFIEDLKGRLIKYEKLKEIGVDKVKIDKYFVSKRNVFNLVFEIYKEYYEKTQAQKSSSADNATKQVYIKLAGDKMGCNYLKINRTSGNNIYCLDSEFLGFITNVAIGKGRHQILLDDFWYEMGVRGFTYASIREKENIEKQLSLLGHLERKSDAGESQYVEHTI